MQEKQNIQWRAIFFGQKFSLKLLHLGLKPTLFPAKLVAYCNLIYACSYRKGMDNFKGLFPAIDSKQETKEEGAQHREGGGALFHVN